MNDSTPAANQPAAPAKPRKWTGPLGISRVYVFDADTGEEIRSGMSWNARHESAIWNGARWSDTTLGVEVVDLETRVRETLTAASFPGRRVVVKIWYDEESYEWAALVDRARGWVGNEACKGITARRELGIERQVKARIRARRGR